MVDREIFKSVIDKIDDKMLNKLARQLVRFTLNERTLCPSDYDLPDRCRDVDCRQCWVMALEGKK